MRTAILPGPVQTAVVSVGDAQLSAVVHGFCTASLVRVHGVVWARALYVWERDGPGVQVGGAIGYFLTRYRLARHQLLSGDLSTDPVSHRPTGHEIHDRLSPRHVPAGETKADIYRGYLSAHAETRVARIVYVCTDCVRCGHVFFHVRWWWVTMS